MLVVGGFPVKREIWDGKRFCEFSWFWNPAKTWVIPVRCPSCKSVVSSTVIEAALQSDYNVETVQGTNISLECSACYIKHSHSVMTTTGDPRNIALIGHWNGWQPFLTSSKHSSGEISCMYIV